MAPLVRRCQHISCRPVSKFPSNSRHIRTFTTRRANAYEKTLNNLLIGKDTRVIFQGFTGRQATANATESLKWGTNIVGGVTPGRTGEHLGLPVLPSVRKAMEELKPDATGIYVAAQHASQAIEEAIEAEVPLIVAVAEHVPLHDMLRIHSILKTQSKSRLVGPNSPGIISAVGKCRIGFQPLPCFSPGKIGIAAKSGTLSYEAVASTTRAGLGQSLCIGVGGDFLPGTDMREALSVLENDEDTEGIALIGEIGGMGEMDAVEWIRDYHHRTATPKPIVALIAGINTVPRRVMGHAGAITSEWEPDAKAKIAALREAGVTIVNHPAKFGQAFLERFVENSRNSGILGWVPNPFSNLTKQSTSEATLTSVTLSSNSAAIRPRNPIISEDQCLNLLRQTNNIDCAPYTGRGPKHYLAIGIDRVNRSPAIISSPTTDPSLLPSQATLWPIDFTAGPQGASSFPVEAIAQNLGLGPDNDNGHQYTHWTLTKLLQGLATVFYDKEAYLAATEVVTRLREVKVVGAHFGFDGAAWRSGGRVADVHEGLRAVNAEEQEDAAAVAERAAEEHGIVYVRLPGAADEAVIGTLVNGAGLAMNTVDALADVAAEVGARVGAANFLDTGGKATSETVKRGFEIVLGDPRVRVVFVNIFGGLTRGDMIADGVIRAFRELGVNVPVVVRIRGTNEEEGRRLIEESGLPLFAFDDFDEAARKAVELARGEA